MTFQADQTIEVKAVLSGLISIAKATLAQAALRVDLALAGVVLIEVALIRALSIAVKAFRAELREVLTKAIQASHLANLVKVEIKAYLQALKIQAIFLPLEILATKSFSEARIKNLPEIGIKAGKAPVLV